MRRRDFLTLAAGAFWGAFPGPSWGAIPAVASAGAAYAPRIPALRLGNGLSMPCLGFDARLPADSAADAVRAALACGFRLLGIGPDAAVAARIRAAIRESGIPRRDLFLIGSPPAGEMRPEARAAGVARLADVLGHSLDILLVPAGIRDDLPGAWRRMEACVNRGMARSLGLEEADPERLDAILGMADIPPVLNMAEIHPRRAREALVAGTRARGLAVASGDPLAGGDVAQDAAIMAVAAACGRTPAQIALAWNLQRGVVVLPGARNPREIGELIRVFDFRLSAADMAVLSGLDAGGQTAADPA